MGDPIPIDLTGLERGWSRECPDHPTCAACGLPIGADEHAEGCPAEYGYLGVDDEDDYCPPDCTCGAGEVPLLLFRGQGRDMESLALHWDCGRARMPAEQALAEEEPDREPDPNALPGLGPCCRCGAGGRAANPVRTLMCLDAQSPISGHGWGCMVCGLACDGAQAVVCDRCAEEMPGDTRPRMGLTHAWRGWASEGLVSVGELTGSHRHDLARHQEGD